MAEVMASSKRLKRSSGVKEDSEASSLPPLPSSVVCTFSSAASGETAQRTAALDLPITSTTKQLDALLNSLLNNADAVSEIYTVHIAHT